MPWPKLWYGSKEEQETSSSASLADRIHKTGKDFVETADEKLNNIAKQPSLDSKSALHTFIEPQTIIAAAILTTASLGCIRFYKTYLRRIPEATNIHQSYFRKRSVFGKVTSVGDGDNFRVFHTPGGWLAGWGWLPWRAVPKDKKLLRSQTIHIRIAGVDAPESAHFGRTAQPYSKEALDWLTSYVSGRRVRAYVHRPDQYSRVVATVYVWKGLLKRDVGLQMLRAGLATVYEAKSGAEFGGKEQEYRQAEHLAKAKKKGMWASDMKNFESPREYKNRHAG